MVDLKTKLLSHRFSQKMNKQICFSILTTVQDRKTNSFVHFWGESAALHFCFEIYWPLVRARSQINHFLMKIENWKALNTISRCTGLIVPICWSKEKSNIGSRRNDIRWHISPTSSFIKAIFRNWQKMHSYFLATTPNWVAVRSRIGLQTHYCINLTICSKIL